MPLREWAAGHGGRTTEYVDLASAADLRGRTAWRRLLDDARHHRLDIVAVWKLDRAFRSSLEAATTLAELRDLGVDFVAITQPIDTTTPTGRLIYAIWSLSRCYEGTEESALAWLEVAALGNLFALLRAEPA